MKWQQVVVNFAAYVVAGGSQELKKLLPAIALSTYVKIINSTQLLLVVSSFIVLISVN